MNIQGLISFRMDWLDLLAVQGTRDGGAWWAAIHWVAQSRTRLGRLSSSVDESTTRRGTDTVHRPEKPAGYKHSSTSGLSARDAKPTLPTP